MHGLLPTQARAASSVAPTGASGAPVSLATLLNPDGTLQRSGFNGSRQARGWELIPDRGGRPHFVRAASQGSPSPAAVSALVGDENWDDRLCADSYRVVAREDSTQFVISQLEL